MIHRQDISCLACILTSSAPSFLHLAKHLCHKYLTNTPHFLTDLHKAYHISCPIRHYHATSISHAHILRHHVRRLGYGNQDWEQDQRRLLSARNRRPRKGCNQPSSTQRSHRRHREEICHWQRRKSPNPPVPPFLISSSPSTSLFPFQNPPILHLISPKTLT